jgi:hypothetical protein
LFCELRPQSDALLGKAPHQFGVDDIGKFNGMAVAERLADENAPWISASIRGARAAPTWALNSPSCWFDSVVLLVPIRRLDWDRCRSTFDSASATLRRKDFDLPRKPLAGAARLILLAPR